MEYHVRSQHHASIEARIYAALDPSRWGVERKIDYA